MLTIAFFLLLAAGLIGLIMAGKLSNQKHPAWSAGLIHACLAIAGLLLIIISIANGNGLQRLFAACAIFTLAAFGGLYLASFHAKKRIPPMTIVIGHGLLAVAGIGLLGSTLL